MPHYKDMYASPARGYAKKQPPPTPEDAQEGELVGWGRRRRRRSCSPTPVRQYPPPPAVVPATTTQLREPNLKERYPPPQRFGSGSPVPSPRPHDSRRSVSPSPATQKREAEKAEKAGLNTTLPQQGAAATRTAPHERRLGSADSEEKEPQQRRVPQWSAVDSMRALRKVRQRGTTDRQVDKKVEDGQREEQDLKQKTLDARRDRMNLRPWQDRVHVATHAKQRKTLRNREGYEMPNPQCPERDREFQPLQYSNQGAFDETLRSKKKGADFRSHSPRLMREVQLKKSDAKEKTLMDRKMEAGLCNVMPFSSLRSLSAPPPLRKHLDQSQAQESEYANAQRIIHSRENNDLTDPRTIAFGQKNLKEHSSSWAKSTTPRIGVPRVTSRAARSGNLLKMEMRGLSKVIGEIRRGAAQSKEEEQKVIDKELHKIRQKFKEKKNMNGYDRKKNVCKLLYIYMLGYEIDFGQMEGVQLLSSDKYSEKHIGYLACTLFLTENDELLTLITHSIKQDLNGGRNPGGAVTKEQEFAQRLALTALANIGGKDFADSMADDVRRIALANDKSSMVKKKALMALLRLYRSSPEKVDANEVAPCVVELNVMKTSFSVVNSILSLVLGMIGKHPAPFEGVVPKVVRLLYKLIVSKEMLHEYVYYTVPAPWLQVKCFRVLQHYSMPTDGSLKNQITSVLDKIITTSDRVLREAQHQKARGTPARNNAMNAVLAEAINLVIHWDKDRSLLNMSAGILGRFVTDNKDTNLRYLGLDLMTRLSFCPEVFNEHVKKHQQTIVSALRDADISIRRKALDLLYVMVDKSNAGEIVGEMLDYLATADFCIKEDLVVKIAILCEKYASDYSWYVDVVMNIISQAGDFVTPDVWQRVVHVVTNNQDIQKHAANTVFTSVLPPAAHEVSVKIAAHILGEFGSFLPDTPESNADRQFAALHAKWGLVGPTTKTLLMTCYAKFYTQYPSNQTLRDRIRKVFVDNSTHMDVEIQQRALEYGRLCTASVVNEEQLQKVFENMPAFEVEQSKVMTQVIRRGGETTDANIWQAKQVEREKEAQQSRRDENALKTQALANWRAHFSALCQDAQHHVRRGVQQRGQQAHLGIWSPVDVEQDWPAFVACAAVHAAKEGAARTPPVHFEVVLRHVGQSGARAWAERVTAQMQQPYSDANLLGLHGSAQHLIDEANAELEAHVNAVGAELEVLLPGKGAPAPAPAAQPATELPDPFAAPPASTTTPAAAAPAPAASSLLDDIFGAGPTPAAAAAPAAAPAPAPAAAPVPVAAAAPAPSGGGMGLDDIFGPGPAAPAPAPAPAAAAAAFPAAAAAAPSFGGALTPWSDAAALAKTTEERIPQLHLAGQGVLYEDEMVQLGLRSEYRGAEGRLQIFIGNKTQAPLTGVHVTPSGLPGLVLTNDAVPSQIEQGAQVPLTLSAKCQACFTGLPMVSISYNTSANAVKLDLPLPIFPTKFAETLNLTGGQQFFQAWQATQSTVNPPEGVIYRSPRDISLDGVEGLLATSLKMKVLRAVDNNQNNMVGAGYFTPEAWAAAPQPKAQYVVLINVETNPGAKAARVTVKTPDANVEKAVHVAVKRYFD